MPSVNADTAKNGVEIRFGVDSLYNYLQQKIAELTNSVDFHLSCGDRELVKREREQLRAYKDIYMTFFASDKEIIAHNRAVREVIDYV